MTAIDPSRRLTLNTVASSGLGCAIALNMAAARAHFLKDRGGELS